MTAPEPRDIDGHDDGWVVDYRDALNEDEEIALGQLIGRLVELRKQGGL